MAKQADPSNPPRRFRDGPRPLAAVLPAITRPAFRARSPATAQLLTDWPDIVGPALAAATQPRRLSGSTLTLACAGPVALELQHLGPILAERINAHFGRVLVERFRFVQDLQLAAAPPAPAPRQPEPVPVPGMAPGPLRDALADLGGQLAAPRDRPPRDRS